MCRYTSLAILAALLFPSLCLKSVRSAADSLAITARSSAAVLIPHLLYELSMRVVMVPCWPPGLRYKSQRHQD